MGKFGVLKELNDIGIGFDSKSYTDVVKSYTDFINGLGWTVEFRQLSNFTWCACAHKWNNGNLIDSRYAFDDKDMVIALQEVAHKILEVK